MNNGGWKKIPWIKRKSTKENITYAKAWLMILGVVAVFVFIISRIQHSIEGIGVILFSCMALAYYLGTKHKS